MADQALPSPAVKLVKDDARIDDTWFQRFTQMWGAYNQTAHGSLRAFGRFDFAAGINASFNVSSITDAGTGIIDVTLTTAFASSQWVALATPYNNGAATVTTRSDNAQSSSTVRIGSWDMTGTAADVGLMNFGAAGDQ